MNDSGRSTVAIESVYVHAPFCPRRCHYCDFPVSQVREADSAGWLSALRWNLTRVEEEGLFTLSPLLKTLFVGGGTPSFLGPDAMGELARILGQGRVQSPELEWTGEANPESFTAEVAEEWARAGVNRVSLGVQSFDPGSLRWLGRIHGPSEAERAIQRAREAGLENLSIDLMFGLPPGLGRDWGEDLDHALALGVPHISLYGLTAEPETPLGKGVARGEVELPADEEYAEEYLLASRELASAGYRHYEVSNFALPGFESRHNRVYWNRNPYLGLGNGAHSFSGSSRRWNLRDWAAYQEASLLGRDPWGGEEVLSEAQTRLETIWLSLRTDQGVEWAALSQEGRALADRWLASGKAWLDSGVLGLSPEGWLLLDDLAVALEAVEDSVAPSPGSSEGGERGAEAWPRLSRTDPSALRDGTPGSTG